MGREDIYQLDEFQAEAMWRMANMENQMLTSIDTTDEDDEDVKKRLLNQRQKCIDLEALGLIEDKTNKFIEQITATALRIGRGYKVFLITTTGFDMFNGQKKRKVQ